MKYKKALINCKAILPAKFDARRQVKYNVQPYLSNEIITIYLIGQFKPVKWYDLTYDPYGPARAFNAKLLRKSPYKGHTRWREQGRKKPCCPARIAYGPHREILSIAHAICELKQLCCYINPDFSVKMSGLSEHSEFDYPKKKRKSAVVI